MDITHGEFVGTPNFASLSNSKRAGRCPFDIYSLGATLWFALTGKRHLLVGALRNSRTQKLAALPTEQLKAAHVPPPLRSLLNPCRTGAGGGLACTIWQRDCGVAG